MAEVTGTVLGPRAVVDQVADELLQELEHRGGLAHPYIREALQRMATRWSFVKRTREQRLQQAVLTAVLEELARDPASMPEVLKGLEGAIVALRVQNTVVSAVNRDKAVERLDQGVKP